MKAKAEAVLGSQESLSSDSGTPHPMQEVKWQLNDERSVQDEMEVNSDSSTP